MGETIRVWSLRVNGHLIKIATVEQGPRKESMCEDCSAPCCQGLFSPILTSEEFTSKRFPITGVTPPKWMKKEISEVDAVAVMEVPKTGCMFYDKSLHICTIWPNCPKACLSYDCREDPRMKDFVKWRMKERRHALSVV